MSTVDTLLDEELDNGYTVLTIDEPTRSIQYEGTLVLGVEHDKYAERIYFVAPKIVGDDIDLSASTTRIDVKFTNGYGDSYYVQSTDLETQDDERVKFSWLLTEKVAEVQGNVSFCVCVKQLDDSSVVEKEWHTAPYVGKIIQGVDATMEDLEIITDYTCPTYQMVQKVEEYEAALETMTEEFNDSVKELDDSIKELDDSIKELDTKVNSKADSGHSHSLATDTTAGLMSALDKKSVNQSASDIKTIKDRIDTLEDTVDTGLKQANDYKLLYRGYMSNTKVSETDPTTVNKRLNITEYVLGDYNDVLVLIRLNKKPSNANDTLVLSEGISSSQALMPEIKISTAPTYNLINIINLPDSHTLCKVNDEFTEIAVSTAWWLVYTTADTSPVYEFTVLIYGR
jgi:Skp family chaperone for outer membrane proteins